ncbi:hypothetical protein RHSP_43374 [Rhizobium freirei PRF 81]|uniref:Uncharacterized protein n=1 Tax=Rhizobium freirei PRF 81 TaxID=363754 RepID=N6V4D3_9HYPH|nr:hypothetical protein RHSP_43374 [Rhizobium freirei PRF 81]
MHARTRQPAAIHHRSQVDRHHLVEHGFRPFAAVAADARAIDQDIDGFDGCEEGFQRPRYEHIDFMVFDPRHCRRLGRAETAAQDTGAKRGKALGAGSTYARCAAGNDDRSSGKEIRRKRHGNSLLSTGKVGAMENVRLRLQGRGRAVEDETTPLKDKGLIGKIEGKVGELLDQKNADAAGRSDLQRFGQPLDDTRRQAKRELVDDHEARLGNKSLRHRHHLLLATGQVRCRLTAAFGKFGEYFVGALKPPPAGVG